MVSVAIVLHMHCNPPAPLPLHHVCDVHGVDDLLHHAVMRVVVYIELLLIQNYPHLSTCFKQQQQASQSTPFVVGRTDFFFS